MVKLLDINLPHRFAYWRGEEFLHQRDLNERWPDLSTWKYATEHELTSITKDEDFAKLMRQQKPPRVLWLRSGNCSLRELHQFPVPHWAQALQLLPTSKLVIIEAVGPLEQFPGQCIQSLCAVETQYFASPRCTIDVQQRDAKYCVSTSRTLTRKLL